jgi:hypothetical protein
MSIQLKFFTLSISIKTNSLQTDMRQQKFILSFVYNLIQLRKKSKKT